MLNEKDIESRRRFLKVAAGTTAAALVLGGLPPTARAADLPPLPETDPTAKALGYVEDGTKSTSPKYKAGQDCSNCQFYAGGTTGVGTCQLFPGHTVTAKGWCVSYVPKA